MHSFVLNLHSCSVNCFTFLTLSGFLITGMFRKDKTILYIFGRRVFLICQQCWEGLVTTWIAKNICLPVSVLGRNGVAMFIFIPVAYHHYFACSPHLNIQAVLTSTSSLSSAHTWCSCFRWVTSFLLKSLHWATVGKQGESNSNNYSKAQLIEVWITLLGCIGIWVGISQYVPHHFLYIYRSFPISHQCCREMAV